jgi:molybdopterin converting factor small subunit
MKKLIAVIVVAVLALYAWNDPGLRERLHYAGPDTDAVLTRAFENRQSDVQVSGEGVVVKLLPDDNEGSRHQRFILRLASGQTLLVAHNIDLAPKITSLRAGDTVEFFGEYEWNPKGGVIHWTHHDPANHHVSGWLRHQGKAYR